MKKIYVCSPLRGHPPYSSHQTQANLEAAKGYCRDVMDAGHLPICPHVFFSTVLDDERQQDRERGLEYGLELLDLCDELWYWGEPSGGMVKEIEQARKNGLPVRRIDAPNHKI